MGPRAKLVMLMLAGGALSVGVVEGSLRAVYRVRAGHTLAGQVAFNMPYTVPVADARRFALRPGWGDDRAGVHINVRGFRGTDVPPRSGPVVVALGDSVPFGYGVKDEETYPAILHRLLAPRGVSVINAGVPSYTFAQALGQLRAAVLPLYHQRMAVIVQAANDVSLWAFLGAAYRSDITWTDAVPHRASTRSALAYYLERARQRWRRRREDPPDVRPLTDAVRGTVGALLSECAARDIRVVLLPIDPRWGGRFDLWRPTVEAVNETLRRLADGRGATFLDSRDGMIRYLDDIHYSPEGHRRKALALQAVL